MQTTQIKWLSAFPPCRIEGCCCPLFPVFPAYLDRTTQLHDLLRTELLEVLPEILRHGHPEDLVQTIWIKWLSSFPPPRLQLTQSCCPVSQWRL
jgi:hypothetical protein